MGAMLVITSKIVAMMITTRMNALRLNAFLILFMNLLYQKFYILHAIHGTISHGICSTKAQATIFIQTV